MVAEYAREIRQVHWTKTLSSTRLGVVYPCKLWGRRMPFFKTLPPSARLNGQACDMNDCSTVSDLVTPIHIPLI